MMRFEGTSAYVATDDLKIAVNAAKTADRTAHGNQLACVGISFIATARPVLRPGRPMVPVARRRHRPRGV